MHILYVLLNDRNLVAKNKNNERNKETTKVKIKN